AAIRLLGPCADFETLMAVGASADVETYQRLKEEAQGLPIHLVPFTEDSVRHIAAADLVVCIAGYNTLCEALFRNKRALIVPRKRLSGEQRIRAELFGSCGLIDVLDPADLTPQTLAERLMSCLAMAEFPVPDNTPAMGGARRAAEYLLDFLQ